MKLRPYQEDAIAALYSYFEENAGNPIVAMPTGTGKSLVIGEFLRSVYTRYPNQRIMMLTHVKELIEQNMKKLLTLWPSAPAGIYSAGLDRRDTGAKITFAGIASVAKRPEEFGHQDLILIDECHLVSQKNNTRYRQFVDALLKVNPHLKVIGFTATPYRLGAGHLTEGGLFTDVCFDLTGREAFNKLIADGYLARLVPKRTATELDVDTVRQQGGEYVLKDLQVAVDQEAVTRAALLEARELAAERKHWLVFATGVEHAEHIAGMLVDMGIAATTVHSKIPGKERDRRIADFKAGRYQAMVNNNVLTTGFDFPSIDCIVMLRPTQSPGLWVQMLGRGTRPAEGKENCLVLDFAGNTRRLGPINDPVLPRKRGEGPKGQAPVRICEECGTYNHASARECEECGAVFPRQVKIKTSASTDELIAGDTPVVESLAVQRVVYRRHEKLGRPPTLRVDYYCGLRRFSEWVCFEHPGFPGKKARDWWRAHTTETSPPPATVEEALSRLKEIETPSHIRVWLNRKYPEVLGHDFARPEGPANASDPESDGAGGGGPLVPWL